jgi:hypothetical protein
MDSIEAIYHRETHYIGGIHEMKKVRIFILITIAIMLFSSCNKVDAFQHARSSPTVSSVSKENQNNEIIELNKRINRLETELQRRVGHLENYFDRRTPGSVASLWGEAVKTRNGALEYALYSKELKDETYDYFVSVDWHTGVSNPHVSDFTINKPVRSEDGQTLINVILRYTISGEEPSDETCTLSLKQTQKEINDDWYITSIKYSPQ